MNEWENYGDAFEGAGSQAPACGPHPAQAPPCAPAPLGSLQESPHEEGGLKTTVTWEF